MEVKMSEESFLVEVVKETNIYELAILIMMVENKEKSNPYTSRIRK